MTKQNAPQAGSESSAVVRPMPEVQRRAINEWAAARRAEGKGGWLLGGGFVTILSDNGAKLKTFRIAEEIETA